MCIHLVSNPQFFSLYPATTTYHNSIAKQLHDSKIQLETQIRSELESEYRTTNPTKNSNVTELENQLRQQLQQVTEERKRWQHDQEEINKKLINSQVQFGKVRDGFKSTYTYVMPCC